MGGGRWIKSIGLVLVLAFGVADASAVPVYTAQYTPGEHSSASAACDAYLGTLSSPYDQVESVEKSTGSLSPPASGSERWGHCTAGSSWHYVTSTVPITWFDNGEEPPLNCTADTIPGGDIMNGVNDGGGDINVGGGAGIYDVGGCAYTCSINYDKWATGTVSLYDSQECTGLAQEYKDADPSNYQDPEVCSVRDSLGRCLEMAQQDNGSCPSGTTYGQVMGKDVCVPSGSPTTGIDDGTEGLEGQGGDTQAEGTPDKAGTGGQDTGGGTTTTTTTTTNNTTITHPDGSISTAEGTETSTEETKTESPKTIKGHGDPASWWETKYPEGAAGIATKFQESVSNGPFMAILDPLKHLPDNGSEPAWSFNVNLGAMGNYGAVDLSLPSGVWAFIRFCILFTAVMTCRKLIFGG